MPDMNYKRSSAMIFIHLGIYIYTINYEFLEILYSYKYFRLDIFNGWIYRISKKKKKYRKI